MPVCGREGEQLHSQDLNDDHKHWLRREKFRIFTAMDFLGDPSRVRNCIGVYAILIRNAGALLSKAGLPDMGVSRWYLRDHHHVYTGSSTAMRSRALQHLAGAVSDSAVRESLLALQYRGELLWPGNECQLPAWEAQLTAWLSKNAFVAFRPCEWEVYKVERDLIERLPSPFNTEGNRCSALIPPLADLRAQFRQHLKATGQTPTALAQSPSEWLLGANPR